MSIDLEGIKSRVAAATPGPWVAQSPDDGRTAPWYIDTHAYSEGPEPVIAHTYPLGIHDADFIAHARADIPLLIEEIERLRGEPAPTPEPAP